MAIVFDGRKFAAEIEAKLPRVKAKLVVVLDPENEAGAKYVGIKKKMADRLGIEMKVTDKENILEWNADPKVDGIVIQMPYPNSEFLINIIDPKKDVDGLREDSPFKPAVVRAVVEILTSPLLFPSPESSFSRFANRRGVRGEVLVVGSKGFVGRRLVKELKCEGMDKEDFDPERLKNADVIISATGQEGLIKPEMVKEGVVAIDLGYPKGDFDPSTVLKASFFTPVPGGVGPVTVVMLFKNLLQSAHGLQSEVG